MAPFEWDRSGEQRQQEALEDRRVRRDSEGVSASLDLVRDRARKKEGITAAVVDACEVGATVGEISDALRDVYGVAKGGRG